MERYWLFLGADLLPCRVSGSLSSLSNLHYCSEQELLSRIVVMSMELSTESISLSGQLVVRNAAGVYDYHTLCLHCASAVEPTVKAFKNSY